MLIHTKSSKTLISYQSNNLPTNREPKNLKSVIYFTEEKTKCPEMLPALVQAIQLPTISSIYPFKKSLFSIYYVLRHYAMYQGYEAIKVCGHCPHGIYNLVGKITANQLKLQFSLEGKAQSVLRQFNRGPKSVILNHGRFCPPRGIWSYLETLLVVPVG